MVLEKLQKVASKTFPPYRCDVTLVKYFKNEAIL